MEPLKKRRGRSSECEGPDSKGIAGKRGKGLVGRYVKKDFVGCGVFTGKIVSYRARLYRIVYDDGDCEDLEFGELKGILLEDGDVDVQISNRKRKLDPVIGMAMGGGEKTPSKRSRQKRVASGDNGGVAASDILPHGEGRGGEGGFGCFDGDLIPPSVVSKGVRIGGKIEGLVVAAAETVRSVVSGEKDEVVGGNTNLAFMLDVTSSITFEHSSLPQQKTSNGSRSVPDHKKDVRIEQTGIPSRLERLRPRKMYRGNQWSVVGSNHTAHNSEVAKSFSDRDTDSSNGSSDSQESDEILESSLAITIPVLPRKPLLPLSSGDIAVPEESITSLFSVYNCLRSFSQRLFLSPFSLDDFVGSLNCISANSLLDAVHVSLLRFLKRHLEMLSSEGSKRASKCLRDLDWSFLDTLTWPVYLVDFLLIMESGGYLRRILGHADVLSGEFYTFSVSTKLSILQILCDHVIESTELRAELDMRENTEAETDSDGKMELAPPINGLGSVHHSSYTSKVKEPSAMEGTESRDFISIAVTLDDKVMAPEIKAADVHDWNDDECRLCGMDGTLVCCDGCPSAYHSRCIGLNKSILAEGLWFCPECLVNRLGPTSSRIGKGLRGADFFGVDPYNQIFFGTCNYLLILENSSNPEALCRYYNQNDVPKAFQVLCSSPQHSSLYSEICKGILRYWEIPNPPPAEPRKNPPNDKELVSGSTPLCFLPAEKTQKISSLVNDQILEKGTSLDSVVQADLPDQQQGMIEASESGIKVSDDRFIPGNINLTVTQVQTPTNTNTHEHLETDSAISCEIGHIHRSVSGKSKGDTVVVYKPQAYINQYVHGDFAASAAANLAVLVAEDRGVSGADISSRPKKFLYQNASLQVKAFAEAAMPVFWPCSEKKLTEVPRERCGWCISCKAPPTSRRGCLLNSAAQNAIKGAGRIPGGLRPIKNSEGPLPAIAAYILYIEESLRGLIAGPFMNVNYRRRWRKQVEQSSTCRSLKLLLRELEDNIRLVAFHGGWLKLVDDNSVELSVAQIVMCPTGPTQKRGPTGRHNRKPATSESTTDSFHAISNVVNWCRRGKLSKFFFKKGLLPCSMVKKAARKGCGIPRRTQQLAWRAAVEICTNLSQLALQVRYLDAHIRWNDLVQLEKSYQYTKGSDTDASAFRNAWICAKRMEINKSIYLLDFGNQKHLPVRVMKNVVEEQHQDEKELFWFAENNIPLYLIKNYEEKVSLSLSKKFPRCPGGRLKTRKGDIFSYLVDKRDKSEKCACAPCCKDVLVKDAVKCSICQGFCHKDCTITSTSSREDKSKFVFTCYPCYQAVSEAINENHEKLSKVRITVQGQEDALTKPSSIHKKMQNGHNHKQTFAATETHVKRNPSSNHNSVIGKKYDIEYGLIWNKENKPGAGTYFRIHNILLGGSIEMDPQKRPNCALCQEPYNSDLMYIRCEICQKWLHADAVQLEEAQIFDLVGFNCCKGRKKTRPRCPYMKPDLLMKHQKRSSNKIRRACRTLPMHESICKAEVEEPTATLLYSKAPGDGFRDEDDPLLFSTAKSEEINEHNLQTRRSKPEKDAVPDLLIKAELMVDQKSETFHQIPKKLPVRRRNVKLGKNAVPDAFIKAEPMEDQKSETVHQIPKKLQVRRRNVKLEKDVHGEAETDEANLMSKDTFSPHVAWNTSVPDASKDKMTFSGVNDKNAGGVIDDMEFEPQTYFSFTELLASEGDRFLLEPFETSNAEGIWEDTVAADFGADLPACSICGSIEPRPDLFCENCRLSMHIHCSQPSWDGKWRCGFCQGQQ